MSLMMRLLALACILVPLATSAQQVSGGRSPYRVLYEDFTISANGADTTEDTLKTFDIPAGLLANVGDRLHIVAGGVLGATTDSKSVRVRFGSSLASFQISTLASQVAWRAELDIVKAASNAQSVMAIQSNTTLQQTQWVGPSQTDTAAITLLVSGQNSTNSVAGSINCRHLTVDFIPAGP